MNKLQQRAGDYVRTAPAATKCYTAAVEGRAGDIPKPKPWAFQWTSVVPSIFCLQLVHHTTDATATMLVVVSGCASLLRPALLIRAAQTSACPPAPTHPAPPHRHC
jgi:hypothetical protein